jgi:alkylation response protein AidB-like acyl-CoA dehydrogenase
VTAIAISEPQAGSDVTAINPRQKDGDCYVLNGRKQWFSYGVAYIVVMARTGDSPARTASAPSLSTEDVRRQFRASRAQDGLSRRTEHADILRQCRGPIEISLARQARVFGRRCALDLSRPTIGAQSVGIAQGALGASIAYAKEQAFKKAISDSGRAVHACRHGDRSGSSRSSTMRAPAMKTTGRLVFSQWRNASAATRP